MKGFLLILAGALGLICATYQTGNACTALSINRSGTPVVGINYDWYFGDGSITVNKRGVFKIANGGSPGPLASWTSKFGSISFTQYGRELVQSGMNEAGLFIGGLLLEETQWSPPDSRPSIRSAQWLQYQLDTASTIREVIESDKRLRISSIPGISSPEHFFVCDRSGACAVIESLQGKPVYRSGKDMPVPVLTNGTYTSCLDFLNRGKLPEPDTDYSVRRFKEAAAMLRAIDGQGPEPETKLAFEILKKVEHSTQWTIVYDLKNLRVLFRTAERPSTRSFSFAAFDFSCAKPAKILDVQADLSGDVSGNFVTYSREANRDLIARAFKKTGSLSNLPAYVLDELSYYPESFVCVEPARPLP